MAIRVGLAELRNEIAWAAFAALWEDGKQPKIFAESERSNLKARNYWPHPIPAESEEQTSLDACWEQDSPVKLGKLSLLIEVDMDCFSGTLNRANRTVFREMSWYIAAPGHSLASPTHHQPVMGHGTRAIQLQFSLQNQKH